MDFDFWLGLLWEEGFDFAGAVILPTILGVLAGIVLAVFVFATFKWTRLIDAETPRLAKALTMAWLGIVLPFTLGSLGFQTGLTKAARKLVTEGRLADTVVPQVGGEIADLVIEVDRLLAQQAVDGALVAGDDSAPSASLDAARFVERASARADLLVDQFLPQAAGQIKSGNPILSGGAGEKIFDWFVERFGEELLRSSLDRHGVIAAWFEGLPRAAEEHGSEGLLSRQELANYTVESLVRRVLAGPFDTIVKFQKLIGGVMLTFALVIPAISLLIVRIVNNRRTLSLS